ncbi:MAG: T9SS type A sorting domain-containing protein [Bacteroidota bacterium]
MNYLRYTYILLIFCGFNFVQAQRYVDVAPDASGSIGALNNAIINDAGADANTIYRLERGGRYFLNGAIINTTLPLQIEAEQGEDLLPQLIPGVTIDGNSDVPFRPQNNIRLKNLFVTARAQGGALQDQVIRIQSEEIRVEVDSCFIDESSQSFIRTDTRGVNIYVTNTIVGRMGTPDDIDNGRVVDDRGNFIDTLVMENNTFYNVTSRVVRDGAGSDSYINKVVFNQNTVLNVGQRMADFGPVIDFTFTNNLIVNPAFNGRGIDPDPFNPNQPEPNPARGTSAIIVDSVSQSILDQANRAQTAEVRNNNIYYTQALLDARPERNPDPEDDSFIVNRTTFSDALVAFMEENGTASTNIEEVLEFSNAPVDPTVFTVQFWNNFAGLDEIDQWDNTGAPFSFQYAQASVSATAGTDGGQLGDLNWPLQIVSRGALEELITAAEAVLVESAIGFNIGNIPQEVADSLQNAVDLAKAVVSDPASTDEEIGDMITALEDAIDYFLTSIITSTHFTRETDIVVYPNPVVDRFQIRGVDGSKLEIYNVSGQQMAHEFISSDEHSMDIKSYQQGLYYLRIYKTDGSTTTHKLIKQ